MGQAYEIYSVINTADAPTFNTDAAYDFLAKHSDPINDIRLAHLSGQADDESFCTILEDYRGSNGGFKGGLDPDYIGEAGSIHSTIEAMRIFAAHQQFDGPLVEKTLDFLKATVLPDGSWQELPEVLNNPQCPQWYQPGQFRICETALIAGYALELGAFDLWSTGARYVRQAWMNMPLAESADPYWAVLLLLGRSTTSADKSIVLDAIDNLSNLIKRHEIDPFDCSTIIEILNNLDLPECNELLLELYKMISAAQDPNDGGIHTAYGKNLRPTATFNALTAIGILIQRGIIAE